MRGVDGDRLARFLLSRLPADTLRATAVGIMARDKVVLDFERDGLQWQVDSGDEIGRLLYSTGSYEGGEIAAVLQWLETSQRSGVVVDVGANVGTTSIPFAVAGYSVVAIEPVPETFAMLTTNVRRNALRQKVVCVRRAIVDGASQAEMWTGFGSGQAEVVVDGKSPALTRFGSTENRIVVPAGRLDETLAALEVDYEGVALVWSDVQGSETSVIRTGSQLWDVGVPLYLEVDPESLDIHGGRDRFVDAVEEHFSAFIPSEQLMTRSDPQPIERLGDFVAGIRRHSYSDALFLPEPVQAGRSVAIERR
jgi:FkbM family methyltransferase